MRYNIQQGINDIEFSLWSVWKERMCQPTRKKADNEEEQGKR